MGDWQNFDNRAVIGRALRLRREIDECAAQNSAEGLGHRDAEREEHDDGEQPVAVHLNPQRALDGLSREIAGVLKTL